jgi:hypothetical protein
MASNDDSELVYALCVCTAAVIIVLSSKNRPRDRLEAGSSNRPTFELAQVLFGLCHKEELVQDEERDRHVVHTIPRRKSLRPEKRGRNGRNMALASQVFLRFYERRSQLPLLLYRKN